MNIGIDVRCLGQRGVGRYLEGLLQGLSALPDPNHYLLFAQHRSDLSIIPRDGRFRVHQLGKVNPALAEQRLIPRLAGEQGLDLIHFTDNSGALHPGRPMVLTLHDGMWRRPISEALLYPTLRQRFQDLYRKYVCPRAARAADRVITVSDYSARELGNSLGITRKLRVIPNALGPEFNKKLSPGRLKAEIKGLGIKGPFIFASGAADRRKNISRLIEAFAFSGLKKDLELVVTSLRPGEMETTDYWQTAARLGVQDRVLFLGYLKQESLMALYQAARGYAFPSLWEGFGLPVLEAYALGCPVLCSRAGALPEVAGEAALICDPESVEDIARGLKNLARADKAAMAAKGRKELKRFSWKRSAALTLKVYAQALGG